MIHLTNLRKPLLLVLALMLTAAVPLNAQKTWSLEECINYAIENNLQIKRQELNVRYSRNNYTQSYFNTLPGINGQVSESFVSGQTFDYYAVPPRYTDQNSWSGNLGLSSNVMLFGGFQVINNILKSKYDYLKSQSDLEKSKNDISLQLALAYMQILFSQELLETAKYKFELTSKQAERTHKLLDVGNVAQGEYLQIKAQESNDKTNVVNAQNNLDISYLDLSQLLDLDSVGGFDIVIPKNIEIELLTTLESLPDIYSKALETMPQIKSAEYALMSSQKQLSMAWGQISPTISLSGSLSTFYSTKNVNPLNPAGRYAIKDQFKDDYNKQVGLGISIPLFNKLQVKNSISNAKLQLNDTELQLEQTKMALFKEVQQAYADALAAREKYNSSMEAVKYNDEAFKYTNQKMEVGLVNSVDYNVAQNNLAIATSNMLQAKYEYIFKLKILDLYMGKQITL
jgi:outer membrane protein